MITLPLTYCMLVVLMECNCFDFLGTCKFSEQSTSTDAASTRRICPHAS